jgi:signal transduction histidine kinase
MAMVHPEDRAHVAAEVATQKSLVEYEYRVQRPDGSLRWLVTRGRAQRDASGRVQSRTGICLDVTERREAQAALQAKELAERANAAKTEFLSRMSHELRTPLNAVLGFAQVMALDTAEPLSEAQRARIGHIQTAGWHLLALINDVLDLARIESRQSALNPAVVPLAEVVDECLVMNAAAAAARGIEQRPVAAEPGLPGAWADRTRVRQVLLNLLSNAVKYNRPGGHVQVSVTLAASGAVVVSVADDGPGLSPQQLEHLFEPFNRLGHENGPVEGTGIGLTLSRLIAQQMGGDIAVDSGPGRGSLFRLVLPAAPLR